MQDVSKPKPKAPAGNTVTEWIGSTDVIPPIIRGKTKRKKTRRMTLPTTQHWDGTVAHTTVGGLGKIARLTKK